MIECLFHCSTFDGGAIETSKEQLDKKMMSKNYLRKRRLYSCKRLKTASSRNGTVRDSPSTDSCTLTYQLVEGKNHSFPTYVQPEELGQRHIQHLYLEPCSLFLVLHPKNMLQLKTIRLIVKFNKKWSLWTAPLDSKVRVCGRNSFFTFFFFFEGWNGSN